MFSLTNPHESTQLELPGAWEPPNSSCPLPIGEGKETGLGFSYGNQVNFNSFYFSKKQVGV
jgi:hypothetical protein